MQILRPKSFSVRNLQWSSSHQFKYSLVIT
jgi:hypothetical protein